LLQGIAVYGAQLPSQDVAGHYQLWSAGDTASLMRAEADVLYLFREGSGRNAHNSGRSQQPDLWIPDHYRILYPTFLHPFWKDFHMNRSKLQDMSNNVIAFIPLGFLTCCWFARNGQSARAFWWAILFGTLLSLSLECIQYFLPMRDSDSMDWLTNTSGTIIGACLGALELRYNWLGKIPVIGSIWRSARLNSSQ
jgi:VanZ family protein